MSKLEEKLIQLRFDLNNATYQLVLAREQNDLAREREWSYTCLRIENQIDRLQEEIRK